MAPNNLDNKNMLANSMFEGFDGIRKDNSRIIFGVLLGIIIIDFIYECI
jgi:hypothetical protein